jgi:mono/diheme cytochrome c family protein
MENRRIQIEVALGAIFIIISSVLLLVIGFQENDALVDTEVAQRANAVEVGAVLYETNCSRCHGENGEGLIGPPLNDEYFFTQRIKDVGWGGTLKDYVVSTVASGRPVSTRPEQWPGEGLGYAMPSWSQDYGGPLRNDQIRDIAEFVMNWQDSATGEVALEIREVPAPLSADPVARGKNVYINQGCGACHAIDGVSAGQVGPSLSAIATVGATRIDGYSAEDYIIESILMPNAYLVEECPGGACPENVMPQNFGEKISEEQLADLLIFLLEQE